MGTRAGSSALIRTPRSSTPKKPRRPGRPLAAAKVDARDRILDAAIALFIERGIAATSLREIATRCGVTPALLHYYFGNRDQLVAALIEDRLAPIFAKSTASLIATPKSARQAIRQFIEAHMRNIAAHPWLPRLMVREVLSEGGALRERIVHQFSDVIAARLLPLIAQAQKQQEIRRDLDPRLIGLSMTSLAVFPFATAPIWQRVLRPGVGELGAEKLIAHTLAIFDSMLEPSHAKQKR